MRSTGTALAEGETALGITHLSLRTFGPCTVGELWDHMSNAQEPWTLLQVHRALQTLIKRGDARGRWVLSEGRADPRYVYELVDPMSKPDA